MISPKSGLRKIDMMELLSAIDSRSQENMLRRDLKVAWFNEHLKFWNGNARYVYEITRRLAKWCKVELVVQDISGDNYKLFTDADIEVGDMESTTGNKLRYWLFLPYYLIKHAFMLKKAQKLYGYDIIISSSPVSHIVCMLAGIKPILVCFELNPWLYSPEYRSGLSTVKRFIVECGSMVAKWIEKRAYKNALKVITYSKYIQSEVKRVYDVDSEVIYTGVDSEFFNPTHNPEIENDYEHNSVILHVASYLSPMKGTEIAIKAMGLVNKEYSDALLVIINSHDDKLRQIELGTLALECGAKVEFVTEVKDEDMPVYYTMAECLLSPSLDENVHLPVLEAACCETPSVGFKGKLDSEDIEHGATGGLAHWKDIDNMANILKLILRRCTAKDMGKWAREFVVEKFNWDKCTDNYKKVICEVINK